MLHSERGYIHILGVILFLLALVGAWYVWKSSQQGKLRDNMVVVVEDYRKLADKAVKDDNDREKMDKAFKEIEHILEKNKISGGKSKTEQANRP